MATYAEFPPQNMATDFTLYPYQEPWTHEQSYLPSTSYAEQQTYDSTTFDSFQTPHAFSPPQHFSFAAAQDFAHDQQQHQMGKGAAFHPGSSHQSPASSASHSIEHQQQPPILSSASDSGASVQSSISSAMGSPAVHPQFGHDWTSSSHLGSMAPEIVQPDGGMAQDFFAAASSAGYDLEPMYTTNKGCVGELPSISSVNQFSATDAPFPSSSSSSPSSPSPSSLSSFHFASNAHQQHQQPQQRQPIRIWPPQQAPSAIVPSQVNDSPVEGMFKSPGTPASLSPAYERFPAKSHVSPPTPVSRRATSASPATSQPVPPYYVPSGSAQSDNDHPYAASHNFSSPFFTQSSGSFVPPLESSYPSLIQPTFSPSQFSGAQFPDVQSVSSPQPHTAFPQAPSPAPSSMHSPRQSNGKASSPHPRMQPWQPYPGAGSHPRSNTSRRHSISSVQSRQSQQSHSSSSAAEDSNKGQCPIATCGRHVKDLRAHMLTHQNERPEKCPIPTCEYHTKGFARKYDKNRHTLTHYKGTMVCGFCPGSGSAAEKSFNRADVFKRHLTSVHNVEQTPPNARKRSPAVTSASAKRSGGAAAGGAFGVNARAAGDVSGMCSTCGVTFVSAQDFYEHLDDCVLRVVQQADPGEAINEKLLSSLADDPAVQETMEKHMLASGFDYNGSASYDEDEDAGEEGDDDNAGDEDSITAGSSQRPALKSRKSAPSTTTTSQSSQPRGVSTETSTTASSSKNKAKKLGMTLSKNGVPLAGSANYPSCNPLTAAGKGNKRRKNYPLSWGAGPEKMRMKKRVLCVYDGQRRLWKDDMMLDADHEVRIPIPTPPHSSSSEGFGVNGNGGQAWITDLDYETLRRAEGVHGATEEERGPWVPEGEIPGEDLEALMMG